MPIKDVYTVLEVQAEAIQQQQASCDTGLSS